MTTHTYPGINAVHELTRQTGGGTLLVAGSGPPYYAGLQRPPCKTLLEALLTVIADPIYNEIVVFTGAGDHLPHIEVGPQMTVGLVVGNWLFRGDTTPDSAPPGKTPGNRPDFGKKTRAATNRMLKNLQSASWPERMEALFVEVEKRIGQKWQLSAHARDTTATLPGGRRQLLIVDAEYLAPPHFAKVRNGDYPIEHQLNTFASRFEALPLLSKGTGVDIVIAFDSQLRAKNLKDGTFVIESFGIDDRSSPTRASLGRLFPSLKWESVPIQTFPVLSMAAPFGDYWPAVGAGKKLYEVLRTVPVVTPPDPVQEIYKLHGLESLKQSVEGLKVEVQVTKERIRHGLPIAEFKLNTALYGNPGTGKTTVARILGRTFCKLGFLSGNKFKEATRADLVAGYVGQTATQTRKICQEALGGVLFIDEVYSLARGGEHDFGREALDELIKWMDEYPLDLAVIVAGYTREMQDFLDANPGIARRIQFHLEFQDYSDDDLVQIAHLMASQKGDSIDSSADDVIGSRMRRHREASGPRFGNAGDVAKLLQGARIARGRRLTSQLIRTKEDHTIYRAEDFENAQLDAPATHNHESNYRVAPGP